MSHIKHTIAVLTAICIIMSFMPVISVAETADTETDIQTEAGTELQAEVQAEDRTEDQTDSTAVDEEGNGGMDDNDADTSEQEGEPEDGDAVETDDAEEPQESEESEPSDEPEEKEKTEIPEEISKEARVTAQAISSGETISYTSKHVESGKYGLKVVVISVTNDGTKYEGTCSQIGVESSKSGKATATKVSNNSKHAKIIYKYAIQKDWWNGAEGEESAKDVLGLSGTVKTTKRVLLEERSGKQRGHDSCFRGQGL